MTVSREVTQLRLLTSGLLNTENREFSLYRLGDFRDALGCSELLDVLPERPEWGQSRDKMAM